MKKIFLKKGKEKAIKNHHHWIFSGAVDKAPVYLDGEVLAVYSCSEEFLGRGYFNSKAKIIGRMLSFDDTPVEQVIEEKLLKAIELRNAFFNTKITNAFRLVNGEGDFLPGLVVDRYNDCLVIQISTLGMEKFKSLIIETLLKTCKPDTILEKSNIPSRKEEGLQDVQAYLYGNKENVEILENGRKLQVSLVDGQKTGFFLDHREMRECIKKLSKGKKVLNTFSYTGGFTLAALDGGAKKTCSVDISESAIKLLCQNVELNGFASEAQDVFVDDVFQFLRTKELDYELIILDPPAFAKRKKDIIAACRGYKDINRLAMKKMPKGSILLTCSCSYHVDEDLFQKVVFQAAIEAGRSVRIMSKHLLALDHPINICHREGDYLKSLLLYVD
jgi:23S rRNA (cytosine1962-C5)-methyltransferase